MKQSVEGDLISEDDQTSDQENLTASLNSHCRSSFPAIHETTAAEPSRFWTRKIPLADSPMSTTCDAEVAPARREGFAKD